MEDHLVPHEVRLYPSVPLSLENVVVEQLELFLHFDAHFLQSRQRAVLAQGGEVFDPQVDVVVGVVVDERANVVDILLPYLPVPNPYEVQVPLERVVALWKLWRRHKHFESECPQKVRLRRVQVRERKYLRLVQRLPLVPHPPPSLGGVQVYFGLFWNVQITLLPHKVGHEEHIEKDEHDQKDQRCKFIHLQSF